MVLLAKDLKKSILQAAIQGKLVEQIEEEGCTKELLKEIEAEKLQLIKLGKIKKTKANPEISENEIPFDIPENWEWVRLESVIYSIGNKSNQIKQSEILQEGLYPVVSQSMNKIEGYSNDEDKLLKISPLSVIVFGDHSKTLKLVDFDFVIGADGTKIMVPISIFPEYLFYTLTYNVINMRDRGYSRHFQFLNERLIPLPPLEEQKRIVTRIEKLMTMVDEYELTENQLLEVQKNFSEEMKSSLIQAAIQGKVTVQLNDDENINDYMDEIISIKNNLLKTKKIKKDKTIPVEIDKVPFEIPESWRWVRLGEIANLKIGKTPPRAEPKWWGTNHDTPWVSIADMVSDGIVDKTMEYISADGLELKFKGNISPKGTLIMSFKLTIGRVSILGMDALHNEAIISIFPYHNPNNILQMYLFKTLPYLTQYGDTKNAIKGNTLNSDSLCNLYIPLPPISEQKRITEELDQLLTLCESLKLFTKIFE